MNGNALETRLAILYDLDRYEQLIEEAGRATAMAQNALDDPQLPWRYLILGLMMLSRFDEALARCHEALGHFPQSDFLLFLQARTLFLLDRDRVGIQVIKQALALNPNDSRYYGLYAELLFDLGRYRAAAKQIRLARQMDGHDPGYRLTEARILYMRQDKRQALPLLDAILARHPGHLLTQTFKHDLETAGNLIRQKQGLRRLLALAPQEGGLLQRMHWLRFYHRVVLPLMLLGLLGNLGWQWLPEVQHERFEPFLMLLLYGVGLLGARDWRFNLPYLFLMLSLPMLAEPAAIPLPAQLVAVFIMAMILHLILRLLLSVLLLVAFGARSYSQRMTQWLTQRWRWKKT